MLPENKHVLPSSSTGSGKSARQHHQGQTAVLDDPKHCHRRIEAFGNEIRPESRGPGRSTRQLSGPYTDGKTYLQTDRAWRRPVTLTSLPWHQCTLSITPYFMSRKDQRDPSSCRQRHVKGRAPSSAVIGNGSVIPQIQLVVTERPVETVSLPAPRRTAAGPPVC